MFPELFLPRLPKLSAKLLKLFCSCGRYWLIDAGQSIMRQADSVSYCWTLWLQRVTFPVPEIPSQNAQKSREIQESLQFCQIERFKTQKFNPKTPETPRKYRKSWNSCRRRRVGCTCVKLVLFVLLAFSPQFYYCSNFENFPLKTQCFQGRILPILAPIRTPSRLWLKKVPFVTCFPICSSILDTFVWCYLLSKLAKVDERRLYNWEKKRLKGQIVRRGVTSLYVCIFSL